MNDSTGYGLLRQPASGYGGTQNAPFSYQRQATRIAQAPKKKKAKAKEPRTRKKEWKAVDGGPQKPTKNIYFLFYFSDISDTYTFNASFLSDLHESSDPARWGETSKFMAKGVSLVRLSNSDTVWTDLGNALHEPGAIVIYWGHSERWEKAKKARHLRPRPDFDDARADITIRQVNALLPTMNAKCFIAAGCATMGCFGKGKRDTAVITTNSGDDFLTYSYTWSNALWKFLLKFIAAGTLEECFKEANAEFARSTEPQDHFVFESGLKTLTMAASGGP